LPARLPASLGALQPLRRVQSLDRISLVRVVSRSHPSAYFVSRFETAAKLFCNGAGNSPRFERQTIERAFRHGFRRSRRMRFVSGLFLFFRVFFFLKSKLGLFAEQKTA
jgi:hypothetical protein